MSRFVLLLAIMLSFTPGLGAAEDSKPAGIPFEGQVNAPDFPATVEWLNTERPLKLADLKGKVVLLDFWTYCCINCMHIIPDLKKLEAKYPKELVVIGVHSAKFANEKETDNIREAIRRYEIEHPVINDKDFTVWRSYSVRAWPSLMLINPNGRVIGGHSGEGIFELFDEVIGQTVKHFDAKGEIDRKPIQFKLEKGTQPPSMLAYPGKVAGDEKSNRLVFSDSNHNRVVVATLDGEIKEVIGDGEIGLKDGSFAEARFFRPQGVYLDAAKNLVYVADTENHAIRLIDLSARTVKTLNGTGKQARRFGGEGKNVDLNSPWDLTLRENMLYIAMAGPHQLWTLDTKSLEAAVYAGSGRENIVDGALKEAALAQPSGITTDGKKLYFVDSEVSAARTADLEPAGAVGTLIGEGLFEFGDVDGTYPKARLQHPLGIAWHDGLLYIADTYNHKIRKLDPKTKELSSFLGTGKRGFADGPGASAQFNEPSGLCFVGGKMYIADANNHLIRVCDLKSQTVSTMKWSNPEKLAPKQEGTALAATRTLDPQKVAASAKALEIQISLPKGTKLNTAGPSRVAVTSESSEIAKLDKAEFEITSDTFSIPGKFSPGKTKLTLSFSVFYCDAGNAGLCYFKEETASVALEVTAETTGAGRLVYAIETGKK